VLGSLVSLLLSRVEVAVDTYMPMAFINMNKGDAKLIQKYEGKNLRSIGWSILGMLGAIGVGLFTNTIYDLVKNYII